jgi:hypothetical protein
MRSRAGPLTPLDEPHPLDAAVGRRGHLVPLLTDEPVPEATGHAGTRAVGLVVMDLHAFNIRDREGGVG